MRRQIEQAIDERTEQRSPSSPALLPRDEGEHHSPSSRGLATRRRCELEDREAVSYDDYVKLWEAVKVVDATSTPMPEEARGRYRLASIDENKRIYIDQQA